MSAPIARVAQLCASIPKSKTCVGPRVLTTYEVTRIPRTPPLAQLGAVNLRMPCPAETTAAPASVKSAGELDTLRSLPLTAACWGASKAPD